MYGHKKTVEAKPIQEPALRLFYTRRMNRRELFTATVAAGVVAAVPQALHAANLGSTAPRLTVPKDGTIRVAFMISKNANVIDLAGPWETFQDVRLPSGAFPFQPYTIAETADAVEMTDGLKITPTYTFDTMPQPHIICVGANTNDSDAVMHMLRNAQGKVDLTMSVCTGAFKLAKSGILDGKSATTHHLFFEKFAKEYPSVHLIKTERFVDNGTIVTAGGLTSGISGALHVISRYFDAATTAQTAAYMEFTPTQRPS
jgi:transcriptional regulator GlxA family with amidase domain